MRMIAFLLAIIAAIAAVVYFTTNADHLPLFMGGNPSSHTIHFKHGVAAAGAAVILFVIGWIVGRR